MNQYNMMAGIVSLNLHDLLICACVLLDGLVFLSTH